MKTRRMVRTRKVVYRRKDKNWSLVSGWTYRWLADLCSAVTKFFFFAVIFVACLYTSFIFSSFSRVSVSLYTLYHF